MIKVIDTDKVMIKATPRGGLKAGRKFSNDGKGQDGKGQDGKKGGGSDNGDGKGQKGGPSEEKMDGTGQMGGWPAQSSNYWGLKQADGGAPGAQKGGATDPGPPPTQTSTPWMGPPVNWAAGDYTPASYTTQGAVDSWKLVQLGDINPWDHRVAKASNAEWKDYTKQGK
eukprot:12423285-Heterocapsa_arctica.AAC.1